MVIKGSLVTHVVVWEDLMHKDVSHMSSSSYQLPSPELELCFQPHDLSSL